MSAPSSDTNELDSYIKLKNTKDPIEAFNLFVQRNLPELYSHFIDSDDNEAEFVRRTIAAKGAEVYMDGMRFGAKQMQDLDNFVTDRGMYKTMDDTITVEIYWQKFKVSQEIAQAIFALIKADPYRVKE